MPDPKIIGKAKEDARKGKSPSTQAGEFVREEMHHIREGKHGARSAKQAIAIGLSEARRAGVKLPPNKNHHHAKRSRPQNRPSAKRSRAILRVLKNEPTNAASHRALSRQGHESAQKRSPQQKHNAAMKAVHTKGVEGLKRAARKAARTRKKAA
jgi:Family of unknown function (DUF6496)